jgi:hypothetical protein
MSGTEPYRDTSVPVSRSKEQIGQALRKAGARGLQLEEAWDDEGNVETCLVRFLWPTDSGAMLRVRFAAKPLPPEPGARGGWKVDTAQRERQAWRGLAWYIESLTKAATFGFVRFEEVFLAYFEDEKTGKTVGEHVIPSLELGQLALPRIAG